MRKIRTDRYTYAKQSTSCSLNKDIHHCITCADELLAVKVLTVDAATVTARVQVEDREEEIDISLLDWVAPGAVVLVQGGVAITCLEESTDPAGWREAQPH